MLVGSNDAQNTSSLLQGPDLQNSEDSASIEATAVVELSSIPDPGLLITNEKGTTASDQLDLYENYCFIQEEYWELDDDENNE